MSSLRARPSLGWLGGLRCTADPDDRDHQPVRERPLIQLDAEALYSLKNRTRWFGTPRRGGGARATRAVVC